MTRAAGKASRTEPKGARHASGQSPAPGAVRAERVYDDLEPPDESDVTSAWRRTWSLVKLASGLVLVLGLSLAVAWGGRHYAMTTPRFAIDHLDVRGARRLSADQVAGLAGLAVGQNVFTVDIPAAEKKLVSHPWIESARITRQLPRDLTIELTEYEARALCSIDGQLFLVTRAGEPFKPLGDSDPFDIPVVTGVSQENLARDRAREIDRIKLGLEVLGHYERLPLSHAFPAEEVNIDAGGSVTLVIGKQGVSLKLGKGPWLMKLRMAERVMGKVQRQGKVPGIIFLDNAAHEERVVVRMR